MNDTHTELHTLPHDDDPARVMRVRVERPSEHGDEPLPHVIVVHGFKGFMHWGFFPELSRRIARAGLAAVSLNLSGSGVGPDLETFSDEEGFARNTYTRELEDVEHVRGLVRAGRFAGVDGGRGAILGHSRGGGLALLHASEDGLYSGVVTWSAIDSVDRFDEETKARWRAEGAIYVHNARTGQDHRLDVGLLLDAERNRERLDVLAACARSRTPTLVVHGTADESVPFAAAERIVAAHPQATLLAVEGAGHTFGATHPWTGPTAELERVFAATLEHLQRCLGAAAT